MAQISCTHEDDVLMLVTTGQWPDRADAGLRAHVAACPVCADLALIAQAVEDERARPVDVALPGAGTVWWRAQLRSRQDAVRESGRPITIAHGMLLAAAGGVAGAVFGATTDWFQRGLRIGRDVMVSAFSNVRLPVPTAEAAGTWLAAYGTTLAVGGLIVVAATAVMVWALKEE
ncbi:MAG TPA: hypothetical protein VFV78_13345 [Vicinamibacterales bacterium]|nr:hypothetical protein [Vicinamibacterales bacterium]